MKKSELLNIMECVKGIIAYDKYQIEPGIKFFNFLRQTRIKIGNELKSIIETRDELQKNFFKQLREAGALDSERSATPGRVVNKDKYKEINELFAPKFKEIDELLEEESELKLEKCVVDTPEGVPIRFLDILADADLIKI